MGDARRGAALRRHGLRRRDGRFASFRRRTRADDLRGSRRGARAVRHREDAAFVTEVTRPWGRYLEDFEEGMVIKHWPGKTITEYDDHLFCLITMNHHPLHLDAVYAETTVLEVRESASKPDRGVVKVETRAYNQRGERVCIFTRRVLVHKRTPENLEKFEPRI